ncbi:MAG: hypothetical protein ACK4KT_04455 [Thermaurantimonas sp.]
MLYLIFVFVIAVRNILLWISMLVIHLHSIIPHTHTPELRSKEIKLLDAYTEKDANDLYTFLIHIFSHDIGENHLDQFECSGSSDRLASEFSGIMDPHIHSMEFLYFYKSSASYLPYSENIRISSPIESYLFRGPPVLILFPGQII